MKVLVYDIEISEGTLALVHGFTRQIKEVYFPKGRLFLNSSACFHTSELEAQNRLKSAINLREEEIDIDSNVILKMIVLLEEEETVKLRLQKAREGLMEWVKKYDIK